MSLVIRLSSIGKKGERKYRVVVQEKRSKKSGGVVASLGWYHKTKDHKNKKIDMEKYNYWVGKGAQPSVTVAAIIKA